MSDKRAEIERALEKMVRMKRWYEFQLLAFHVAKRRWPDLVASEWFDDGGEDGITVPSAGSDGKRRSLACSLSGTLVKVRADCTRIQKRKVPLDVLVFCTPITITTLEIAEWQSTIRQTFKHDLVVIPKAALVTELEHPDNDWICREYLEIEGRDADLTTLTTRVKSAAMSTVSSWKATCRYDASKHIDLSLRVQSSFPNPVGPLHDSRTMCDVLRGGRQIVLKGLPGAGKTFTLIRIAEQLATMPTGPIPLLISLPHWALRNQDLLTFLQGEPAFELAGVSKNDLARLNHDGLLVFLLNGWNEISPTAIERAVQSLDGMLTASPATAFIITTRETLLQPPMRRPIVVSVEPLDAAQRRAIVLASGVSSPAHVIDSINGNATLEQITRTPLFLATVLDIAQRGGAIPSSRYGILAESMRGMENDPAHQHALVGDPCRANHGRYLSDIAVTMTVATGTALRELDALKAITASARELLNDGVIVQLPDPPVVLEVLVSHHVLTRSHVSEESSVRFAHQQFQEWFAANHLLRRLKRALQPGDRPARRNFQKEILNEPIWGEALGFLAECLDQDDVAEAYAQELVSMAMVVDLVLAAELARLAGWNRLGGARTDLTSALRTCYARPRHWDRECALAGMFATGSADFGDIIWPLLEHPDKQVRLGAYRTWAPFSLSCLGEDWAPRVRGWSKERRKEFIGEMWWKATSEHCQVASDFAREDPELSVRTAALEMLAHAGAWDTVVSLLERPSYTTWPDGVYTKVLAWMPRRYGAPLVQRVKAVLHRLHDVRARIEALCFLDATQDPDALALMKSEVEGASATPEFAPLIERIYRTDPAWAVSWVAQRMAQGDCWEDEWTKYLDPTNSETMDMLAHRANDKGLELNQSRRRLRILAEVAPNAVAQAVTRPYLSGESARRNSKTPRDGWTRLDVQRDCLRHLPFSSRIRACLAIADNVRDRFALGAMLDLLGLGTAFEDVEAGISEDERDRVRQLVFAWHDIAQAAERAARRDLRTRLGSLLGTVGKPEDAPVLKQWIDADRSDRLQAVRDPMSWSNWYSGALARLKCSEAAAVLMELLSDQEYFGDASAGLLHMARPARDLPTTPGWGRPDYEGVWERRPADNSATSATEVASDRLRYAEAIAEAIESRLRGGMTRESSPFPPHSLMQASVALANLAEAQHIRTLVRAGVPEALEIAVLRGFVLPGGETYTALDPIITMLEQSVGRHDANDWYYSEQCIRILLFTDNPGLGVARIRQLPASVCNSYRVRELLHYLGLCRAPEAGAFLGELPDRHDILQHCMPEYIQALAACQQHPCRAALLTMLDQLLTGQITDGDLRWRTTRALADAVAAVAATDESVYEEIESRCATEHGPEARATLLSVLEKLDPQRSAVMVCTLLDDQADKSLLNTAMRVIENALIYKVAADTPNAYYIGPRSADKLRKHLLTQVLTDQGRKRSSMALLMGIEANRLEHGKPIDERRHPDIDALDQIGGPWPLMNVVTESF